MRERGESRPTKHLSQSFEDLGKEDRIEEVGEGQGYRGPWCLPRAGLNHDAGGLVEGVPPYGRGK